MQYLVLYFGRLFWHFRRVFRKKEGFERKKKEKTEKKRLDFFLIECQLSKSFNSWKVFVKYSYLKPFIFTKFNTSITSLKQS